MINLICCLGGRKSESKGKNSEETQLGTETVNNEQNQPNSELAESETNKDVKNILVIGITGNGKSALASLLANNDEFKASSTSTSKTKHFQVSNEPFEWKDTKYRLIDNIGFGDTDNISEEEIFLEIGEGIHSAKDGINQVLFIFKGRFGPEHVAAFNKFKKFISESGITKYTTLVRTRFPDFRNEEKCKEDEESLLSEENKDLREIINSCNGFVHIDNPPIPEIDEADEDDKKIEEQIKEKKEASREKVLNHLVENCCKKPYKIGKWDNVYQIVDNYIKKREEIGVNNEELRKETTKKIKEHLVKEVPVAAIEYSIKK